MRRRSSAATWLSSIDILPTSDWYRILSAHSRASRLELINEDAPHVAYPYGRHAGHGSRTLQAFYTTYTDAQGSVWNSRESVRALLAASPTDAPGKRTGPCGP